MIPVTDNLKNKNILCYSHYKFDCIMESKGWYFNPGINCSAISICSPNEYDLSEHWFKDDCHGTVLSVFNLDIDDCGPMWFTGDEYDKALELYLAGSVKESNEYFNHNYQDTDIHILNYEEAFDLVKWIDNGLKDYVSFYMSEIKIKEYGVFDVEFVSEVKKKYYKYRNPFAFEMWKIFQFQMWYERWMR